MNISKDAQAPSTVGAIGVAGSDYGPVESTHYNPVTAVPGTVVFTGNLAVELGKARV